RTVVPGYTSSNDDPTGDCVESDVGAPNPDHEHVVMGPDGRWRPAPGYKWSNDDPKDYSVELDVGAPNPDHEHVVMGPDGRWRPAPGYKWSYDDPKYYSVELDGGARWSRGEWKPFGSVANVLGGCVTTWTCQIDSKIIRGSDTEVLSTESQLTSGTCSIKPGDPESCGICNSLQPAAS